MTKKQLWMLGGSALLYYILPLVAWAALVPCGNSSDPTDILTQNGSIACNLCDLGQLIDNILTFLIAVTVPIAVLLFAYSGILMFTSAENPKQLEKAKKIFKSVFIGFAIAISAWLVVEVILHTLVNQQFFVDGKWNKIECVSKITSTPGEAGRLINTSVGTVLNNAIGVVQSPAVISRSSIVPNAQLGQGLVGTSQYLAAIQQACLSSGTDITDCEARVRAIMVAESSGNANIGCNSVGACGLMQIKPDTACQVDTSIPGCSGGKVANLALVQSSLQDPTINIKTGVTYFDQLDVKTNGSLDLSLAAYNGGPGAVGPSADCPGLVKYLCPYDSLSPTGESCYNTGVTGCKANVGYVETRNYVTNIKNTIGLQGAAAQ